MAPPRSLACTESFSYPDVFLDSQKDGYVDVIRKSIVTVQEKFTGEWTREVRQVGKSSVLKQRTA